MPPQTRSPRAVLRDRWNAYAAAWERWEPALASSLASVDPYLLRALRLAPGQHILDVGCGTGDPALAIAPWVAPRGTVTGVDISVAMLDVARRRARLLRLRTVRFRRGDFERPGMPARRFDRVVSRYGVMFAPDVARALEALRACLRPGGRAAFAVWGPLAMNPGQAARAEAVRPFLNAPLPDPETVPHPARFARKGLLARCMRRAGFRRVETIAAPVCTTYPSVDAFVRMQRELMLSETFAGLGRADQRRLEQRLRQRMRVFQNGELLRIPGQAWVVAGDR